MQFPKPDKPDAPKFDRSTPLQRPDSPVNPASKTTPQRTANVVKQNSPQAGKSIFDRTAEMLETGPDRIQRSGDKHIQAMLAALANPENSKDPLEDAFESYADAYKALAPLFGDTDGKALFLMRLGACLATQSTEQLLKIKESAGLPSPIRRFADAMASVSRAVHEELQKRVNVNASRHVAGLLEHFPHESYSADNALRGGIVKLKDILRAHGQSEGEHLGLLMTHMAAYPDRDGLKNVVMRWDKRVLGEIAAFDAPTISPAQRKVREIAQEVLSEANVGELVDRIAHADEPTENDLAFLHKNLLGPIDTPRMQPLLGKLPASLQLRMAMGNAVADAEGRTRLGELPDAVRHICRSCLLERIDGAIEDLTRETVAPEFRLAVLENAMFTLGTLRDFDLMDAQATRQTIEKLPARDLREVAAHCTTESIRELALATAANRRILAFAKFGEAYSSLTDWYPDDASITKAAPDVAHFVSAAADRLSEFNTLWGGSADGWVETDANAKVQAATVADQGLQLAAKVERMVTSGALPLGRLTETELRYLAGAMEKLSVANEIRQPVQEEINKRTALRQPHVKSVKDALAGLGKPTLADTLAGLKVVDFRHQLLRNTYAKSWDKQQLGQYRLELLQLAMDSLAPEEREAIAASITSAKLPEHIHYLQLLTEEALQGLPTAKQDEVKGYIAELRLIHSALFPRADAGAAIRPTSEGDRAIAAAELRALGVEVASQSSAVAAPKQTNLIAGSGEGVKTVLQTQLDDAFALRMREAKDSFGRPTGVSTAFWNDLRAMNFSLIDQTGRRLALNLPAQDGKSEEATADDPQLALIAQLKDFIGDDPNGELLMALSHIANIGATLGIQAALQSEHTPVRTPDNQPASLMWNQKNQQPVTSITLYKTGNSIHVICQFEVQPEYMRPLGVDAVEQMTALKDSHAKFSYQFVMQAGPGQRPRPVVSTGLTYEIDAIARPWQAAYDEPTELAQVMELPGDTRGVPRDARAVKAFADFCRQEHNGDSLDFMIAVATLKKNIKKMEPAISLQVAKGVAGLYIAEKAEQRMNVAAWLYKDLIDALEGMDPATVTQAELNKVFDEVAAEVTNLFKGNMFSRFINAVKNGKA